VPAHWTRWTLRRDHGGTRLAFSRNCQAIHAAHGMRLTMIEVRAIEAHAVTGGMIALL
jgi:hypothetical protein